MEPTDKNGGANSIAKAFGTSKAKEEQGVWFSGPKGQRYLIARQGNDAFTKLAGILTKPHRRLIEKGLADPELLRDITAEVTAKTLLLDWDEVKGEDGKPLPYTWQIGKAMLVEFKDFADFVAGCSTSVASYQDEEQRAAAGN